jgi:low affinity Fe/Cu permease
MRDFFNRAASKIAATVGSPAAFITVLVIVIGWALTGPIFKYSDTWQLVINTTSSVVTFLMVFLIQNTQNRDSKAFHIKLNELIRGVRGARTELVDVEDMPDEDLEALHKEFEAIHRQYASEIERRTGKSKKPKQGKGTKAGKS